MVNDKKTLNIIGHSPFLTVDFLLFTLIYTLISAI